MEIDIFKDIVVPVIGGLGIFMLGLPLGVMAAFFGGGALVKAYAG